jgi:TPR repeat protein
MLHLKGKIPLIILIMLFSSFSHANGINREGIEMFKKQAIAGDVLAMNRLGNIYKSGLTSDAYQKPDYLEALKWFEAAAAKKYPPALFNIGTLFEVGGFGINRDLKKAVFYFETSYNMGFERSLERLRNVCKIPEAECLLK